MNQDPILKKVRLTAQQLDAIRSTTANFLSQPYRLTLFGSRVDLHAKGGDIDLMLELDEDLDQAFSLSSPLKAKLMLALHGLKVDLIFMARGVKIFPIHEIAMREGIRL